MYANETRDERVVYFWQMIEVMPIVDHVLVWLFGNDVIFPESPLYSYVRVFGCVRENIMAGEILFHAVLFEALCFSQY